MSFKESNSKYENIEIQGKYIYLWSISNQNTYVNINSQKFEDQTQEIQIRHWRSYELQEKSIEKKR